MKYDNAVWLSIGERVEMGGRRYALRKRSSAASLLYMSSFACLHDSHPFAFFCALRSPLVLVLTVFSHPCLLPQRSQTSHTAHSI